MKHVLVAVCMWILIAGGIYFIVQLINSLKGN